VNPGDILEPVRSTAPTVVVAADPDVVDAGHVPKWSMWSAPVRVGSWSRMLGRTPLRVATISATGLRVLGEVGILRRLGRRHVGITSFAMKIDRKGDGQTNAALAGTAEDFSSGTVSRVAVTARAPECGEDHGRLGTERQPPSYPGETWMRRPAPERFISRTTRDRTPVRP